MKTQVLVQGYYGAGNLGDDALMVACFELLSQLYPPKAITFRSTQLVLYLHRLVPNAHMVETETQLDSVGLQVYGGGTQHFTFPLTIQRSSPAFKPLPIAPPPAGWRFFQRKQKQSTPLIARRAAIGIGFGPFEREEDRAELGPFFQQFGYVAVRDPASLETCRQWGLTHAVLRSDLCFLPGLWDNLPRTGQSRLPFHLGVIVRDWPHSVEGATYREPLQQVVADLRHNGLQVTYVLFQKGEAWETELTERGEMVEVWDPNLDTIPRFLSRLAQFDCLLTARYHGAVFGALLGKPIICIEIEPKLSLAAELLANNHLWRQPFLPEACLAQIYDILHNYKQAQTLLLQAASNQRRLANKMKREFCNFVSESPK